MGVFQRDIQTSEFTEREPNNWVIVPKLKEVEYAVIIKSGQGV